MELAGIEVYSVAEAPAEFQPMGEACGVIILWTSGALHLPVAPYARAVGSAMALKLTFAKHEVGIWGSGAHTMQNGPASLHRRHTEVLAFAGLHPR